MEFTFPLLEDEDDANGEGEDVFVVTDDWGGGGEFHDQADEFRAKEYLFVDALRVATLCPADMPGKGWPPARSQ
jgi:hypothetical protein